MAFSFPNASIVIATFNNAKVLRRTLNGMLKLDYPARYEIIVIDDGSRDGTVEMMQTEFAKEKKITFKALGKNSGVCRARNTGIALAKYPIVVNMDHDCIPEKNWLRNLMKGFENEEVGVVSSFGGYGGTSTAFRKEVLDKIGGYDEKYFYYREDTDLTFGIMDLGYKYKKVKADYLHDHKEVAPKGILQSIKYVIKRLLYHENDVLLFKKHPKLAGEFLQVKFGFMINPVSDFKVVANLWDGSSKELKLGSPRGITFIENKTPLHTALIIFAGLVYVVAVKLFRLWGSIKFRKLLI